MVKNAVPFQDLKDPVNRIKWMPADDLEANDYNPNMVFSPELKLLELNILTIGWVQPIIITRDNIIIDGFHRWMLSRESPAVVAKYHRMVPCVVLDIDRPHAMTLTVRMNRAKGAHVAIDMSKIVHALVNEHGWTAEAVATEIGATQDEIKLLLCDNVFKQKDTANYKYSRAWYPRESKRDPKPESEAVEGLA